MNDCLFCKISDGRIPSDKVYESDTFFGINDINPQAPTHILIVPVREIVSINDLAPGDAALVGKMVLMGKQLAEERGFAEDGYRLVFNVGDDGGQTVDHIHLHLLGGRAMAWPPG